MELTQESILSLLLVEGGKVKKTDLVGKFKGSVDCDDPAERQQNRELFKTFVNNVAFVKEIDGVRYVVVRKQYQKLLEDVQTAGSHVEKTRNEDIPLTGEQQRPPSRTEKTERSEDAGEESSAVSEADEEEASDNPTESLSPIELALQRSKFTEYKVKRMLNFEVQNQETNTDSCSKK